MGNVSCEREMFKGADKATWRGGSVLRSKTHTERFKLVCLHCLSPFPLEAYKTSVCVSVCVFVCACERAYTHVHMQELGREQQIRTEICTDFPENTS